MSGLVIWGFFNNCVTINANVFMVNVSMFSKVYFPRLVVPLANVCSTLFATTIQIVMFGMFLVYFMVWKGFEGANAYAFLLPVLIIIVSALAIGVSTVIAAVTVVYRDLSFLISFAMQLWMYATTIIYPLSTVPDKYKVLILFNPMVPVVEAFRYGFLGHGMLSIEWLAYSLIFGFVSFFIGVVIFNMAEQTAMDTV